MTLQDKDIFPNVIVPTNIIWQDRITGKVILFNEKREIALIGNKVNDLFLLPGGGIESSETLVEGITRECLEETGCRIKIQEVLGVTEDFRSRDSRHYISFVYLAKAISYGTPKLTPNEIDVGAYVIWVPLPEAISIFATQVNAVKAGKVGFYNTCFNILRDNFFISQIR